MGQFEKCCILLGSVATGFYSVDDAIQKDKNLKNNLRMNCSMKLLKLETIFFIKKLLVPEFWLVIGFGLIILSLFRLSTVKLCELDSSNLRSITSVFYLFKCLVVYGILFLADFLRLVLVLRPFPNPISPLTYF